LLLRTTSALQPRFQIQINDKTSDCNSSQPSVGWKGLKMTKSTSLRAILAGITCLTLACATAPAVAQHMGGHGSPGGGFHGGGYHGGGFQGYGGWHGGYHAGAPTGMYHGGPSGTYHGSPSGRMPGNSVSTHNPSGARGAPQGAASAGRGGAIGAGSNGAIRGRGVSGSTAPAHAAIVDGQWHSFATTRSPNHPITRSPDFLSHSFASQGFANHATAVSTGHSSRVAVATTSFTTTWHGAGWWGHPATFVWGCCGWGWGWGWGFGFGVGFGFGFGWGSLWSPYWYWPPYSYYPWGYYPPPLLN